MKVLQLTFHDKKNFGAFLQSFALQKYLEKLSVETEIFDYRPSFVFFHPIYLNERLKRLLPLVWHLFAIARYFQKNQSLCPFLEMNRLKKTKRYYNNSLYKEKKVDCFVVGSDQVWNSGFIKGQESFYFLDFLPKGIKKISYAASLGVSRWPSDFENRVVPMLKEFDAISVRENSSVDYLKSLGLENVCNVCDPTLLHDARFYIKEFDCSLKKKDPFVFSFLIREPLPEDFNAFLKGKLVVSISPKNKKSMSSVAYWLSCINGADFIVTDSFHCVVFSLIFHKPFVVIPSQKVLKGMNERFATLLERVGLQDRIYDGSLVYDEIVQREINWSRVDEALAEWRKDSEVWLKEQLAIE